MNQIDVEAFVEAMENVEREENFGLPRIDLPHPLRRRFPVQRNGCFPPL